MTSLTRASTSRRLSSRCFCSSSRLLASEPTPSGIPDVSATPNAVESTSGHAASAAAPSEVPVTEVRKAGAGRKGASLNDWLAGEGSRYRRPMNKSTNWLARTPFPSNPSFAPKPPISDLLRTHIYNQVKESLKPKSGNSSSTPPKESAVLRSIAQKHNISVQRVAAIVKLKVAQEQHVKAGFALQKPFNDGMESALGVSGGLGKEPVRLSEPVEGTNPVLTQQMRQVFEMPNQEAGEHAILPSLLESASQKASSKTSEQRHSASADQTWRVASRRKEASPTIVVENVSSTPLGRQWERTNKNDSASEAVKRERAEQRKIKQRENEVAWEAYT